MNGKYCYLAISSLLGALCALCLFLPFFIMAIILFYLLFQFKRFSNAQMALVVAMFFLTLLTSTHTAEENKTIIPDSTAAFFLEFTQDSKIDGDLLLVAGNEKRYKENLLIRYRINTEAEKEALKGKNFYGSLCKVSGELDKPPIAKNPSGFNYRKYLETKKIYWILDIHENPLQHCIPIKPSVIVVIKQIRFYGINYLEDHFPPEIASLSAALIFGDTKLLDPEILADYQKTGLVHLLAISGLHVSLLIGMVFYLGIRTGLTRQGMTNFLLFLLPIYAVLTGGSPSVIRSVLMIFLVLMAEKWKSHLKLLPIDAISIALMVYLLFAPLGIFDIGFQLSFAVSFGIIVSAPYILKRYQKDIARMLVTSLIAQLTALPFLLFHYFEMSLISIGANLIYIPLFSFLFLPGLYLLLLFQLIFGKIPQFIIYFFRKVITSSNQLIGYLSDIYRIFPLLGLYLEDPICFSYFYIY